MEDKKLKIGFNAFDSEVLNDTSEFRLPFGCNPDFVWCHSDPSERNGLADCDKARALAEKFKELGCDFIVNFEFQNFAPETYSANGYDWSNAPDGTHRLRLYEDYVKAFCSCGNLIGIAYDEFEHVIINRNISLWLGSKGKINKPAFRQADTKDALVQGKELENDLKEYAGKVKEWGSPSFSGEHVFPVLYHLFARCGIIPNFKSQKESVSNIQFAIAAGAALQYGTPLYNCVDMWHKLTYPGHSAEEMYNNLKFAYYAGVNRVYVEAESALVNKEKNALNDAGLRYEKFCKEYKGKERNYDVSDYRPEIGIIRYDDSYWGQNLIWARGLFGNKKIHPDSRSREWLKILHTVTRGDCYIKGPTWNRIEPHSLTPHRSFITMNSLAVFDDNVTKETLSSLKLCFLTGLRISEETLGAVASLVRENGLVAVCPERFAPAEIRSKIHGSYCEIKDGKGCWIVTGKFTSSKLAKRIEPFLGNRNEIRLTFADNREIRLKIDEKGEKIDVI